MTLEAVDSDPGLWINPAHQDGTPGVYALIAGVSRYLHLNDGPLRIAPQTYGLGQLTVSALTAFRFFEWLDAGYTLQGLPIAQVRLLLAPLRKGDPNVLQDELLGCNPAVVGHAAEPTFGNCRMAILKWHAAMRDSAAPGSRSLFFFSGHGLEIRSGHQVLLPTDYLDPSTGVLNEAISTFNLIDCLPYLANVNSHVLFIDACRNDVDALRSSRVDGTEILNSAGVSATNHSYDQSILYATTTGLRAYSPRQGGASLYGQALLDGLSLKPNPTLDEAPLELRSQGPNKRIEIDKLTAYMRGRVEALVRASGSTVVQAVRVNKSSGGSPVDLTEFMPPPALPDANSDVEFRGDGLDFGPIVEEVLEGASDGSNELPRLPKDLPDQRERQPRGAWFDKAYPTVVSATLEAGGNDASDPQSFDYLHGLLGSEAITYPWLNTLTVDYLGTDRSSGRSAIEIVEVAHADEKPELRSLQVHLRFKEENAAGYLLQLRDLSGRVLGCCLPADLGQSRYQIEIDVGERAGGNSASFLRFAGYLSSRQDGSLGRAAKAWDRVRSLSVTDAVQEMRVDGFAREVETMLQQKFASPLAATIGALILFEGGRLDRMHDWTRNLANSFPDLSDGSVLWFRQETATERATPKLLNWLVEKLARQPLPFTASCFGVAADLVSDIKRGRYELDPVTTEKGRTLADRFDQVMPYFREDGLFCSYANWPEAFALGTVLGPQRSAASAGPTAMEGPA